MAGIFDIELHDDETDKHENESDDDVIESNVVSTMAPHALERPRLLFQARPPMLGDTYILVGT